MDERKIRKIRADFPIFKNNKGLVYLDNAATSQRPEQVIQAVKDFYEKDNANIHRGVYDLAERATQKYEDARKVVAKFINADEKEVIFTKNATEALNLLSYSLSEIIENGRNEIVLTEMEHHSNLIPWQQLAKRNKMKLKIIKMNSDYTLDMKDAEQKITEKTAIVSFVHASNVLGTINPAKEIVRLAKSKKAISIIDAAQSVPHMGVDVKDLGCDFLAFSSHKMLGPTGIGVLYGKKELLEKLPPFLFGGGMIKKVEYGSAEWADIPHKFEAGTQNIGETIGMAEAVRYLEKIGMKNIEMWEKYLLALALDEMRYMEEIEIYHPEKNSIGIISFNVKGVPPHDVASIMDSQNIAIRAGHNCTMPLMNELGVHGVSRVSFYFYNTVDDVKKFLKTLKKIIKMFR